MSGIDLQQYCYTGPGYSNITRPFSRGEFTYATNGHIAVRVLRRADAPEVEDAPLIEKIWVEADGARPCSFPGLPEIPQPERRTCWGCRGSGRDHECPTCKCLCESCDGTGFQLVRPDLGYVGVGKKAVALKYAHMLAALPDLCVVEPVRVVPTGEIGADTVLFTFNGGSGMLMPMRQYSDDSIIARAVLS